MREEEHDDYDEGMVCCVRCQGGGFIVRILDDARGDREDDCPVCYGEGQITRERADHLDKTRQKLAEILATALKDYKP